MEHRMVLPRNQEKEEKVEGRSPLGKEKSGRADWEAIRRGRGQKGNWSAAKAK